MTARTLAIVGTDTDVGKTAATLALAAYWQTYHPDRALGILKPIQSGAGDREQYARTLALTESLDEIAPLYFQAPLAPAIAAAKEGKTIDLALAWQQYERLRAQKSLLLVEASGGLGSPLTWEYLVADLVRDWKLPALLVVPVRLGSIGQAIANVALARQYRIDLRGIILNCTDPDAIANVEELTPPDLVARLTGIPVWGCLPFVSDLGDRAALAQAASQLALEGFLWR